MSAAPGPVATFSGVARVQGGPEPLNLRISGQGPSGGSRPLEVCFSRGTATPALPAELHGVRIEALAPGAWRLLSGDSEWVIAARAVHVHEDPRRAVQRVLPPRRVPLRKRAFWMLVLTLVRSDAGRRLLLRLRG